MTDEDVTSYGFLCGADMEPGKIRRNPLTSAARFVDIGSTPAALVTDLGLPLPDADEVWGVVVSLSAAASEAPQIPVILRRTGNVVQAVVLTDATSFGAVDEAVEEAYYWELPRSWREALVQRS